MNKKGRISLFNWVKFILVVIFYQGVGIFIILTFIEMIGNAFPTRLPILVNFIKITTAGFIQFIIVLNMFYIYPNKEDFYK